MRLWSWHANRAACPPTYPSACLNGLPSAPVALGLAYPGRATSAALFTPQASGAVQQLKPIQQVFVLMTLMHSETLADQNVSSCELDDEVDGA